MINKITGFTFNHSEQVDDLYQVMTTEEMKAKFDSRADELKTKVNETIEQVNTNTTDITKNYNTLDTKIDNVNNSIGNVVLGQIPDNTITEMKMAPDMKKDVEGGVASYDKVASDLADIASQEVGKGADIIGLPDPNNLFTATNVGEAMNELFTNVSNGKNLVGGAITGVDDSVVIPTDPMFSDLASAIGSISTGKKWASGTPSSPSSTIEVDGLSFKPTLILIHQVDARIPFTYYNPDVYNGIQIVSGSGVNAFNVDADGGYVITGGFKMRTPTSTSLCSWIAFE